MISCVLLVGERRKANITMCISFTFSYITVYSVGDAMIWTPSVRLLHLIGKLSCVMCGPKGYDFEPFVVLKQGIDFDDFVRNRACFTYRKEIAQILTAFKRGNMVHALLYNLHVHNRPTFSCCEWLNARILFWFAPELFFFLEIAFVNRKYRLFYSRGVP